MVSFLYVVTLISSVIGALVFLGGVVFASSAPQEAAASAAGVALAVIPYVLTRCVQLTRDARERRETHRELLDALQRSLERNNA